MEDSLSRYKINTYDVLCVGVTDGFFLHFFANSEKARPSYRLGARAGLCIQSLRMRTGQELEFSPRSSSSELLSMVF